MLAGTEAPVDEETDRWENTDMLLPWCLLFQQVKVERDSRNNMLLLDVMVVGEEEANESTAVVEAWIVVMKRINLNHQQPESLPIIRIYSSPASNTEDAYYNNTYNQDLM